MIKSLCGWVFVFVFVFVSLAFNAPLKLPQVWSFMKPVVIKMKLYQHDTIVLVWYDTNGDKQCNKAELIEKTVDYFVAKKITCKMADEADAYILEPHI